MVSYSRIMMRIRISQLCKASPLWISTKFTGHLGTFLLGNGVVCHLNPWVTAGLWGSGNHSLVELSIMDIRKDDDNMIRKTL